MTLFTKYTNFGQARQLADLGTWDFLDLLGERKMPLRYGAAELEEDHRADKSSPDANHLYNSLI